jgi:4-amino-4-deoxy-L-arabinose transferase-like glycosyltransferase
LTTTGQGKRIFAQRFRPSQQGWALLLLVVLVAAGLRFWQLGETPSGLYRDEAANGLDALDVLSGERQGQSPFYFTANNGREPAYIYLTSLSLAIFGNTTLAVRLMAAVMGTLTTWFTYKLAETWFGRRVGLLSAAVWAITVWPIHLSRIGLRPILLPLMLALVFWLGTLAYRRSRDGQPSAWLWLLTGFFYGVSFYTYLAVRFTPVLLGVLLVYLFLTRRNKALWPGTALFAAGTAVTLVPLILLALNQPEVLFGRLGQVSISDPGINNGDLLGTLWRHLWQTLGLFFVAGDDIIRHNPPGRPLFDLMLVIPFLAGLVWAIINWRRTAAMTLLLWVGVMLAPTILAEDAPHFLRAVGILPAALIFPAIGLSLLWTWPKIPRTLARGLVIGLLLVSAAISVIDYFGVYGRQPETAYWFEAAASDLAADMNNEAPDTTVYLDRRFWEGWPAVRFLANQERAPVLFSPTDLAAGQVRAPAAVYAWPYERLDNTARALASPALVSGQTGSLAQGDLEPEAYPLYVRYASKDLETLTKASDESSLANFDNAIQLRGAEISPLDDGRLQADLYWSLVSEVVDRQVVAFVHVIGPNGLVGQSDSVPGDGNWPAPWWRSGLIVADSRLLVLDVPYEEEKHQILIGLYDAVTQEPLPVLNEDGLPEREAWLWQP